MVKITKNLKGLVSMTLLRKLSGAGTLSLLFLASGQLQGQNLSEPISLQSPFLANGLGHDLADMDGDVVNNQGVILKRNQCTSNQNSIDISVGDLAAGNYFLLINDGQSNHTMKFFKF